jgi:hypothetical protein
MNYRDRPGPIFTTILLPTTFAPLIASCDALLLQTAAFCYGFTSSSSSKMCPVALVHKPRVCVLMFRFDSTRHFSMAEAGEFADDIISATLKPH